MIGFDLGRALESDHVSLFPFSSDSCRLLNLLKVEYMLVMKQNCRQFVVKTMKMKKKLKSMLKGQDYPIRKIKLFFKKKLGN